MDCGNKDILIKTNSQIIEFVKDKEDIISSDVILQNSKIIHPCYIASGVKLINSTVGPHVSISSGVILNNCKIRDSIIRENSELKDIKLNNSMIGQNAFVDGEFNSLNLGDFCRMEIKA
jgi:glucose-1-phosphate thymidylyltransferase